MIRVASTLRLLAAGLALLLVGTAGAVEGIPDLGPNASLNGKSVLPRTDAWNLAIDREPVDPNSDALIASIGRDTRLHPDFGASYGGGPYGIPYVVVPGSQPRVRVTYTAYANESDPGPFPIPASAPIEGGVAADGDRHVLVIDRDNWRAYELFRAFPDAGGWRADSGAVFDLRQGTTRPAGWTSADAAGLPIFPGLVRYDEVVQSGAIRHAIRFTVQRSRRGYIAPARHFASSRTDPNLPPMGMRVRLRAGFDIQGFPPQARVILQAMKTHGMILADNGSNWFFSGAPDKRWNDEDLGTLKRVTGKEFEVVRMGPIITR